MGYFTEKVEQGVPVPPKKAKAGKGYSRVVASLQLGDSVWLPTSAKNAYAVVYYLAVTDGRWGVELANYEIRPEGDGARIWRTK
ncbi:MAG: hypothetical protein ACRD5R_05150 [Candidatus Acidiferrales bacterium]